MRWAWAKPSRYAMPTPDDLQPLQCPMEQEPTSVSARQVQGVAHNSVYLHYCFGCPPAIQRPPELSDRLLFGNAI